MKFRLLLFALGVKLRISAIFSAAFRRKLRKMDLVLAIRTGEVKEARTYVVKGGRVRSRAGRDRSVETELVWCDRKTAVRIMLSKNELDGFSAIGRGQLRILGNFEQAFHFLDLAG